LTDLLKFGKGNAKLGNTIYTFSIPAGHSCPGACKCLSKADPDTGKIKDGLKNEFRCFAASQEALYPTVRLSRWNNFKNLMLCKENGKQSTHKMVELIQKSLPKKAEKVRVHVSGDFYIQEYFDAWLQIAKDNPDTVFYAYTKSLKFWIARLSTIPDNLRLTASRGGNFDNLIEKYNLPEVQVVFHPSEAGILEIDHDDSHAWDPDRTKFALLLHGTQPKGSKAAEAKKVLQAEGHKGYSRKHKEHVGSYARIKA
jgi:hypothetical protein